MDSPHGSVYRFRNLPMEILLWSKALDRLLLLDHAKNPKTPLAQRCILLLWGFRSAPLRTH